MTVQYKLESRLTENIYSDNECPLDASNDVFQIRNSGTVLLDCHAKDTRCRTSAHCDFVQIIPDGLELNAQYFGKVIDNIIIGHCSLESNGSMQGIFASDGGFHNIVISDQVIDTESQHKITLGGVFIGAFLNNKDSKGNDLEITLEPMRIGGGLHNSFYVSSFKDHEYHDVITDQEINDLRKRKHRKGATYVDNFDLNLWRSISESFADEYDEVEPEFRIQNHFDKCLARYEMLENYNKNVLPELVLKESLENVRKIKFVDNSGFDKFESYALAVIKELGIADKNQIAYIFATIQWETNHSFEPVEEAYWLSDNWRMNNLRYYPWHGRGFIQLTWEKNYKKAYEEFGIKYIDPDLMLNDYLFSLMVSIVGMRDGWFTGKKLSDYINNNKVDFLGARRIVNGTDKNKEIAELANEHLREL